MINAPSPKSACTTPRISPTASRRVGLITTTRADAGIYGPLLRILANSEEFEPIVFAGGTHHSIDFGRTSKDIEDVELVCVKHFVPGDSPGQVAKTAGLAITEFSYALARHPMELLFALGDRTETLAACLAALIHKIPIAHLHGGDTSEGAIDEQCRHAITKLAHVHFPAINEHAQRILRMGEERWRVHAVGALALDEIRDFVPMTCAALSSSVGLSFNQPSIILLFHPETLSEIPAQAQIKTVLDSLENLDANILVIGPNADVGHAVVRKELQLFAERHPSTRRYAASLTQQVFWSCLTHARALVGNSSSGILEAPSFAIPVLNIGGRQKGRLQAANVLNAAFDKNAITAALTRAMSPAFRSSLDGLVNPYGDGRATSRIINVLRALPDRRTLLTKHWTE